MSGDICFLSFHLPINFFLPGTHIIMTLRYFVVALLMPFNYEDKRLLQKMHI